MGLSKLATDTMTLNHEYVWVIKIKNDTFLPVKLSMQR